MQAVVKTPHIEINISGEIPSRILKVLSREYGEAVKISQDDDSININQWDWYLKRKASLTSGKNLRIRRENKGLTQAQLAEIIGMSAKNISGMERDKRSIGGNIAVKLSKFFHVPADEFLSSK